VLGTLARRPRPTRATRWSIVSADKDLLQLVRPASRSTHTVREKLYDRELVTEDIGVPPEQVADVLALMGDSIDNIPGVPGIGEKGAKALIASTARSRRCSPRRRRSSARRTARA
jgi:DNA polymerase-1